MVLSCFLLKESYCCTIQEKVDFDHYSFFLSLFLINITLPVAFNSVNVNLVLNTNKKSL